MKSKLRNEIRNKRNHFEEREWFLGLNNVSLTPVGNIDVSKGIMCPSENTEERIQ